MLKKEDLFEGFTIGEWEVLPGHGVLCREGWEELPESKVFAVLIALAGRDGNLVTRDDLVNEVWDGRPTSDEPINRCLSQLRGHLDDRHRPYQYVETLQRRGYRLMKPVQLHKQPEPSANEIAPQTGPSLRRWRIVAAVMALGFLATIVLTMRPPGPDPGIHSIALLPIENLSGDPGNQYIVDGIKDVLARRLSESPELAIKNTRVRYTEEPSRIAELLDVDSVLSGTLQLQDSTLKVTYLLTRGDDNVTIGSGEVDGNLTGIFALQERLATAVRNKLIGPDQPTENSTYTPNSDAYNRYMRGMYALQHRGEPANLEKAIELFQQSIRLDENFGPAYLSLATAYALMADYRNLPVEETDRAAIQTVEKGIAVDSTITDAAAAIYGLVLHQKRNGLSRRPRTVARSRPPWWIQLHSTGIRACLPALAAWMMRLHKRWKLRRSIPTTASSTAGSQLHTLGWVSRTKHSSTFGARRAWVRRAWRSKSFPMCCCSSATLATRKRRS